MPASALATSAALRVASLDLCADEYLLALAKPSQIASTTFLSHDPMESAYADRARGVARNDGTVEAAAAGRPTALLTVGGVDRGHLAARLGIAFVRLAPPETPADVIANLERVATLLGRPASARPYRAAYQRLVQQAPATRRAWLVDAGGQAGGTLGQGWMRLSGYVPSPLPGGRVTLETLVTGAPPYLLVSRYRDGQFSRGRRLFASPTFRDSSARKVATDGRRWTCGGPPMLAEALRLRGLAR